jgi:tripartite ATP-independent transporter DctM subunit
MTLFAVAFVVLVILGVPIAFAMAIASMLYLGFVADLPLSLIVQNTFSGSTSFILTAIPFFMLAGELMNEGGVTRRLVDFCRAVIGHVRGGLAHVNIMTSMLFAGISGSAVADASAVGSVLVPAMEEDGYDRNFSAGVTASSACVGPIIPPSIPMVIFGVTANTSIGALFLAGAIPGILLGLAFMALTVVISIRRGYPRGSRASFIALAMSTARAFPALLMPLIIVVGISGGYFTATEAAAAAAVYAFLIGTLYYRTIRISRLPALLLRTANLTASVMLIVAVAKMVAWIITAERVPQMIGSLISGISQDPTVVLLVIALSLLVVGTFLETAAAIIILVPVFLPIVAALGIDPIHFGVVTVLTLVLGMLTPPVGLVLFVVSSIANLRMEQLTVAVMPFFLVALGVVTVVVVFPELSLWLPRQIMQGVIAKP